MLCAQPLDNQWTFASTVIVCQKDGKKNHPIISNQYFLVKRQFLSHLFSSVCKSQEHLYTDTTG